MKLLSKYLVLCIGFFITHFAEAASGSYVVQNGVKIYYQVTGEGYPIALLSGGPGQNSIALSSIANELSKTNRVILIDQRGTGKSNLEAIDESTINLDNYIKDIEAVRKHLKIKQWILLGHSWGGGLAMAASGRHPESSAGMILIGSLGIKNETAIHAFSNLNIGEKEKAAFKFWGNPAQQTKDPERAAYELYRTILPSRLYDKNDIHKILGNYRVELNASKISRTMMKQLMQSDFDFSPALKNYSKPVLIIQGRQGFMGGETVYDIRDSLSNSSLKYIERSGHFPFIEQPEAFFKTVNDYLTNNFSEK